MSPPPEHEAELATFPVALQALVRAELASGNTLVEIGHGHPAPPVGAYVLLARKVTTRPRATGGGLDFYARSNSHHAGEFTDTQRFFFVLEAPDPPPPEPDMDAIRKAHDPHPSDLSRLSERPSGSSPSLVRPGRATRGSLAPDQPSGRPRPLPAAREIRPLVSDETSTGVTHTLHFRDPRPPQAVRTGLERTLMVLFTGAMEDGVLCLRAQARINGARAEVELRFTGSTRTGNAYSLRVASSWGDQAATHHDYFRRASDSWFRMWTRDLSPSKRPHRAAISTPQERKLCEEALRAEADLDSVPALQQAVLSAFRNGGRLATSHKEGGTLFAWRNGRFTRTDHGDDPGETVYRDEAHFLGMLRQFCQMEVTRHAVDEPIAEKDGWKLILRRVEGS